MMGKEREMTRIRGQKRDGIGKDNGRKRERGRWRKKGEEERVKGKEEKERSNEEKKRGGNERERREWYGGLCGGNYFPKIIS